MRVGQPMSFDVFFFSYLDGKPVPFPLAIVEDALGRFADRNDPTCWALKFPDGGWSDLYLRDAAEISHFCLNRPASSRQSWLGVFEILRATRGILSWPSGGSCVTDASVVPRIDFIDCCMPVTVVDALMQIWTRIQCDWPKATRLTVGHCRLSGAPPS